MSVRIIGTSGGYGAGHSERVIARAIRESDLNCQDFVICTKAGTLCDPESGNITGYTDKKGDIAKAIDESLRLLGTDYLDLVKFHTNRHPSRIHTVCLKHSQMRIKLARSRHSDGAMMTLREQWLFLTLTSMPLFSMI